MQEGYPYEMRDTCWRVTTLARRLWLALGKFEEWLSTYDYLRSLEDVRSDFFKLTDKQQVELEHYIRYGSLKKRSECMRKRFLNVAYYFGIKV